MIKKILIWLVVQHWSIIIVLVAAIFLILAITAILDGYLDYKQKDNAPKEEMFWCTKHGAFPRKHTLPLFPHLQGGTVNTNVCPTCFKEAAFDTPDQRLKHG